MMEVQLESWVGEPFSIAPDDLNVGVGTPGEPVAWSIFMENLPGVFVSGR